MLTATERGRTERDTDAVAGWLVVGALLLPLGSEAALSLPDETDKAVHVAGFYHDHMATILLLQIAGLAASMLLGAFMWRLRLVDTVVGWTGVALAAASVVPGAVTAVLALVAAPAAAGRLNRLQPRGDDLLFAVVIIFALVVIVRLGRAHHVLGVAAATTALACATRLLLETQGHSRGLLETVAPLCFLGLIAIMGAMSFRAYSAIPAATAAANPHPDTGVRNG